MIFFSYKNNAMKMFTFTNKSTMPPRKRDPLQQLRIPDNRIYSSIGHEINLNRSERKRYKPTLYSSQESDSSPEIDTPTRTPRNARITGFRTGRRGRPRLSDPRTTQNRRFSSKNSSRLSNGYGYAQIIRHDTQLVVSIGYPTKYKSLFRTVDPEYDNRDLPYRGILSYPDCIINNTDPTRQDRDRFEKFQRDGDILRVSKQNVDDIDPDENATYQKSQISKIQFRDYEIATWYTSPYPEEYSQSKILYICEHCLKYMNSPFSYDRHRLKNCNMSNKHPPGVEIYRDDAKNVALWEVDGRKNMSYCQNLCLLAKLFLNSKTLYYDVEPFIFYIMTEIDETDPSIYHFVGYFSKEKLNSSDYNVSCILTLPIYQRKGYGNLLIDFSYLLSRNEFKFGTPEKPLSDLGLLSYRNYWKISIAYKLKQLYDKFGEDIKVTIDVLCKLTGMIPSDVVVGLEQLDALIKNPVTKSYAIAINLPKINGVIEKFESKKYVSLDGSKLLWKPMLFGPSGGINSFPLLLHPIEPVAETALQSQSLGTTQPLESHPAPVHNSIGLLSNFLKDDIDNPYTFEEEAFKEIELLKEVESVLIEEVDDFVVCKPPGTLAPAPINPPILEPINETLLEDDKELEEERESDFEEYMEPEEPVVDESENEIELIDDDEEADVSDSTSVSDIDEPIALKSFIKPLTRRRGRSTNHTHFISQEPRRRLRNKV